MSWIVVLLGLLVVAFGGFGMWLQVRGDIMVGTLRVDYGAAYLAALAVAALDVAILAIVGGLHVFG